jgi:hypothetical protein
VKAVNIIAETKRLWKIPNDDIDAGEYQHIILSPELASIPVFRNVSSLRQKQPLLQTSSTEMSRNNVSLGQAQSIRRIYTVVAQSFTVPSLELSRPQSAPAREDRC